mgnify:CR=1 FL=1
MKLTIPFYLNKAGAGFPSPATDYIEEDVDLNVHLIKNVPATFIIRVQGQSMADVGIYDGDLLVIGAHQDDISGNSDAGSAYVFKRGTNGQYSEVAKIRWGGERQSLETALLILGPTSCSILSPDRLEN